MDYSSAIAIVIFLTTIGAVALYYGVKKEAGKFFYDETYFKIIRPWQQRQNGLKILKKRLEKGEISQQEYDELKKQFENPSTSET